MSDELTDDQIYATYFDANGRPARPGVQLSETERREYAEFFPETTTPQTTEEIR